MLAPFLWAICLVCISGVSLVCQRTKSSTNVLVRYLSCRWFGAAKPFGAVWPRSFQFGNRDFGNFLRTFLPCPGLAEHGDSEGSNAPPCCLLWLCSSDIFRHSCEFSVSREGPFFGKFGEMPDSKPNPRKVELLKEWLEDLLKPGYVNQRIESLKKAIYKNKASEVRVLIKPTKQSFNPSFGAGEVSLPLPRRHEHHGFGGTGGNPIKFILGFWSTLSRSVRTSISTLWSRIAAHSRKSCQPKRKWRLCPLAFHSSHSRLFHQQPFDCRQQWHGRDNTSG